MVQLNIDKLTKSFGDLVLFEDISFGIEQGQKIGLIAKNGSGKTTLLNIIAGKEDYDSGSVVFRNDLRVGYLEQAPSYPEEMTVLQACFYSQNETVRLIAEYEEAMERGDERRLEDLLVRMDALKAWDYEQRAKQILGQLKIHHFEQRIGELSGGQLKRVALANVLITDPELIILDEPTNHLDLEMTEWLEGYLSRANISLLMVTHDRYFLDRVCNEILEIDRKQIYSYKGNYNYYLEKDKVTDKVVVFGGGLAGCECAIHLGMEGKEVHLVEMRDQLAPDANVRHRPLLLAEIEKYVTVHTGYKGKQVTDQGILCEDKEGKEHLVPGTTVICALGQRSRTDMVEKLRDAAPYVAVIGDAAKVSTITNAVYWGYHGALDI